MNGSNKAFAINRCFAIGKDRDIVRKAKSNHYAKLHAHATHALYLLRGSLRGLLRTVTVRPTDHTLPWCTWTSGMQPCRIKTVRRRSSAVVVA